MISVLVTIFSFNLYPYIKNGINKHPVLWATCLLVAFYHLGFSICARTAQLPELLHLSTLSDKLGALVLCIIPACVGIAIGIIIFVCAITALNKFSPLTPPKKIIAGILSVAVVGLIAGIDGIAIMTAVLLLNLYKNSG